MRANLLLAAAVGAVFVVAASSSVAWETVMIEGDDQWTSIYLSNGAKPLPGPPPTSFGGNEHAEITELALQRIGADGVYGVGGSANGLSVVDLNASWLRPELKGIGGRFVGTYRNGPLETRALPPMPFLAGIPDFSYSLDDWINKNQFCPPRVAGDPLNAICHVYSAWLGAGFNSSHFGSQASANYLKLHATALWLANRAGDLRRRLEAANSAAPGTMAAWRDAVREAEAMALAYEAVALHYLEDRWSMGHMWERWNGPDVSQSATPLNLLRAMEVAAASGFVHGSEAVTGAADPMSAPYVDKSGGGSPTLDVSTFTTTGDDFIPGVGDDRLLDMFDGQFGKEYEEAGFTDFRLVVTRQRTMMLSCVAASLHEVITAFGANGGGFGLEGVALGDPFGGEARHDCLNHWATNHSIYLGWMKDEYRTPATVARLVFNYVKDRLDPTTDPSLFTALRGGWVEVSAHVAWDHLFDPQGTTLARGGMGSFGDIPPGNAYGAASYIAPTDLSTLPARDPNGRDTDAFFGFFNRAHADHFCSGLAERLRNLRGSDDPVEKEVCRMLADRAWAGTDPVYGGIQREVRQFDGADAAPICSVFDGEARISLSSLDPDLPYYLHPGYVPARRKGEEPSAPADAGLSSQSVANWCDRIPVLDYVSDAALRDDDVVAEAKTAGETVTLRGDDLGEAAGTLTLTTLSGGAIGAPEVKSWSDGEIVVAVPKALPPGTHALLATIKRSDGSESQGRFVINVAGDEPKIASVKVSRGDEVFYEMAAGEETPRKFRPISAGTVEVEVTFETDMLQTPPPEGPQTVIGLGLSALTGAFVDARTWRGTGEVPLAEFTARRGVASVDILAATADGIWLDSDTEREGLQPDKSHRVVIDTIPPFVQRVTVTAGGETIYASFWREDPKADDDVRMLEDHFRGERRFTPVDALEIPAEGEASIAVVLSRAVDAAPSLTVGGVAVPLNGSGTEWSGTFDLVAVQAEAPGDYVHLVFKAADDALLGFDADPRSPPSLDASQKDGWWLAYQTAPGTVGQKGGEDRWHKLGPPPSSSLVIILDASGSMGEDPTRIAAARAGIAQTLDALPANVEVGAVIFFDCNNIASHRFSRIPARIREILLAAEPSRGTPLAASIGSARLLFETDAHAASRAWRYAPFTDGAESCGGNTAAEFAALEASAERHRLRVLPPLGDPADLEPPPETEPEKPAEVACEPARRTGYFVDVEDGGLHLDSIMLIETSFTEIEGANGCVARLIEQHFRVDYATRRRPDGTYRWTIQSTPRHRSVESVTAADGVEAFASLRERATMRLDGLSDMAGARAAIEAVVQRNRMR